MTQTGTGSRGEPTFASSGNPPTFAADLTLVGGYAAKYGNLAIGTTAERNSWTPTPWEGLFFWDTDLKQMFVRTGGVWVFATAPDTIVNATIQAGWSGGIRYLKQGRICTVLIEHVIATADVAIGAWGNTTIATGLPAPIAADQTYMEALTNSQEYGGFAYLMTSGGALGLQSRWVARTFSNGQWLEGSFTYLTAS